MFETKFGIEIEFSGITRKEAAEIVVKVVNGSVEPSGSDVSVHQQPKGAE